MYQRVYIDGVRLAIILLQNLKNFVQFLQF